MEIENKTQWHPAFCAAMELELRANKNGLTYNREHNLSSESLRIDLLIIKKNVNEIIENEIGAIFLGHNIIEYKSPDDKMNIDTFYKVLAYACLYKSDTGIVNEILDTDITITIVRERKPIKLMQQLGNKYDVVKRSNGIYQINGVIFPTQIIVTRELEKSMHIWLKSLKRDMVQEEAEELLNCSDSLRNDAAEYNQARSVINLVSDINKDIFEKITSGDEKMSEKLKYMVLPELKEKDDMLAEKDAVIAERDAELVESKKELKEKDAEIERLRRELAAAKA